MVKDIVLSVLLPVVVQKLQCSARCVVELALICEFGTYHEVVGIILEGSRSEFATLIGVGPGLCGLPRILFPRLYEKSSQGGQPPRHQANHGSIYQRFAART
jgi:hypothetical protein